MTVQFYSSARIDRGENSESGKALSADVNAVLYASAVAALTWDSISVPACPAAAQQILTCQLRTRQLMLLISVTNSFGCSMTHNI
jgi:hypothetical protein